MASSEGGVEIEEVAAKHPEKILRESVDPVVGPRRTSRRRKLAFGLGLKRRHGRQVRGASARRSTAAYVETDASLAEINPLVVTQGRRA